MMDVPGFPHLRRNLGKLRKRLLESCDGVTIQQKSRRSSVKVVAHRGRARHVFEFSYEALGLALLPEHMIHAMADRVIGRLPNGNRFVTSFITELPRMTARDYERARELARDMSSDEHFALPLILTAPHLTEQMLNMLSLFYNRSHDTRENIEDRVAADVLQAQGPPEVDTLTSIDDEELFERFEQDYANLAHVAEAKPTSEPLAEPNPNLPAYRPL